ncbi:MAG: formimidoylglutamase [Bacteroidota bacterium]
MDLNEYFDPVSLDKSTELTPEQPGAFCKFTRVHTPDQPIPDTSGYNIGILGVPEERGTYNIGTANAPDTIRNKLYQLNKINNQIRVIDLGNLKQGTHPKDTYFGLKDVLQELIQKGTIPIIMGGSQELSYPVFKALTYLKSDVSLVSIDSRVDMHTAINDLHSLNFLRKLISNKNDSLFNLTSLAYQQYFVDSSHLDELDKHMYDNMRIGQLRQNITEAEPILRDSSFVSIDIGAIRHSDAPGHYNSSSNGLHGEEICQLARYAGLSEKISAFGIFEVNPRYDINNITSHLAAQIIWYFMQGFSSRKNESPELTRQGFKKFIIKLNTVEYDLIFYKSLQSDRWWMEIPVIGNETAEKNTTKIIACSYKDYQDACNQEIPDRWWKNFQRIN